MVFFTSILIVLILYYLQADGYIYVIVIAVIAELINIIMTQTLTKSVEKKITARFGKVIGGYKTKLEAQKKTIKEYETFQEKSIGKLHKANLKIREYEEKLGLGENEESQPEETPAMEEKPPKKSGVPKEKKPEGFDDLPSGSNRKQLPV